MADSIVRLRVDSQEYDNKLKRAAEGLNRYIEGCRKAGGTLEHVDDGVKEFTQQLGKMGTVAGGAKGKLGEMTKAFTDLTMQFNQMSEAEKNGQFGKALSSGLDELKQRIISTKKELADINSSLNGGATGGGSLFSSDKLSGMLQVFGGNLMTKGAGMALGFAGELKDMVAQGIELAKAGEGVRLAFQRLGRGDILQGLREATHGTVTDLELMKAAVKFNDFKLPLDELGVMLAYAQQKAKDTGQSVDYMVESITNGLGRKSLMILDNLGLSAAEIKEKMAETGDMTKAVGEIIREQMSKAGDYVETAADRATQANVELENAMTRLGETFQPLTDSANSMWTDIKVGALDLLNNAIKPLIDRLTEAGRLRAQLNNINAGTGTNQTRAGKDLGYLKYEISKFGANDPRITDLYNRQRGRYIQQENQAWRQSQAAQQRYENLRKNGGSQADLNAYYQRWQTMEAQAKAWGSVLKEYDEGFKKLTSSAKVNVNTDEAEQNITSLTKKLKDLQAERKKAIAAGDTDKSKNLLKQINQVKADIKGLGGTTTTTTKYQTPQQRAQESFTKAEQNYKQALEQAAMELEAGRITRAQAKEKEMQAAEQRWKAIGDARNINDSENLRKAQDEAAANYKALSAEVKTATEHQKAIDKATRDLENANQKLATARTEMAQAKQQGDLQAYNMAKDKATAAQQEITRLEKVKVNVETGKVDLPNIPTEITQKVDFEANTRNIDAAISYVKKEMDTIPVGTIEFNLDQTKLADLTTLKTLITEQVKNGLQIDPNFAQSMFQNILAGKDIENTTWQAQVDNINKNRTANGRTPLKINYKTGEKENDKEKEKKTTSEETLQGIQTMVGSLQSIAGGINQLGIELPQELTNIFGVLQTITGIVGAIQSMQTVGAFLGIFHNGGVVPTFAQGGLIGRAADGMMIPGNSMSGDRLRLPVDGGRGMIGVNSGELILNRAQQGVIASALQDVGQMSNGTPYITGELIFLGLNNYLKSTGRGEIMTSRFKG